MAMTQRRWFCQACQREWLPGANAAGANQWTPEQGCPGCRSAAIAEVQYQSAFAGGDIPREHHAPPLIPAPVEPVAQAPPLVLIAEESERNWAVELSGARE